jgi:hypothetical protein
MMQAASTTTAAPDCSSMSFATVISADQFQKIIPLLNTSKDLEIVAKSHGYDFVFLSDGKRD